MTSKRRWTKPRCLAACAAAVLFTFLQTSGAFAGEPWTMVVIPDTQHYVDDPDNVDDFVATMTWLADNIVTYRISFVTHIGDVVQHGDEAVEWDRAESAMRLIDGRVPYSVSCGDHDYAIEEDRGSGAVEFVRRYGASRYAGRSWYRGASPDQKSHYQIFTAGGRQFLHLNIEWEVPGAIDDPTTALGWARQVLDSHPTTPTIISTHAYVWDKPGEKGRTNGVEEASGDGRSGETLWAELIRNRPQVFMIINGNFHNGSSQYDPTASGSDPAGPSFDGEWHQVSRNLHGLPVYEMLSNYQDYPNGGDGWIRLIEFQDGAGAGGLDRIQVRTYSPTHDAYQTDSVSQFSFDLDFEERFDRIPAPLPLHTTTITAGHDAYVWKNESGSNYGSSAYVRVDTADGGPQQGLIRFDIGSAVPAEAEIVSADLRLSMADSGNGLALHRMLMAWSQDSVTWNGLGEGIATDGHEATSAAELTTPSFLTLSESPCHSLFDVTASVRAWHAGAANHGWALMPLGSDKLSIRSFESSSLRPELVIQYVLPSTRQVRVTTGEDAYIWKLEPDASYGSSDRIRVDLSDGATSGSGPQPMQALLRFDIVFGTSAGAIAPGAEIVRAELRLRLVDSGHGFRLHRMRVPWREATVTWNSTQGGIDDDGVEADADPDVLTADYLDEPATPGYTIFDVTAAVRAWSSGEANHGWVLLPLGDDKLVLESLQGTSLRPELVITHRVP